MIYTNQLQYLANGYRHIAFGEVDSTNLIALEYWKNGDPGKLWITAQKQNKGKGSRGRSWVSMPGNLYASLLLCSNAPAKTLANLSFVTALALYNAVAEFVPEHMLSLKWPNDLLLNRSKVSGILLENHSLQGSGSAIIIGMGINCVSNPDEANYKATNLSSLGKNVEPEELFGQLAVQMDKYLGIWDNGDNFITIRKAWRERAQGIGKKIKVNMPQEQIEGVFEDIDFEGCLIVKMRDGQTKTISSADIFFCELGSNPN